MKHVLTVDIGTTSTKVMLVSESGKVIRTSQSFYPTHFPAPGQSEQDPHQVLIAVLDLVRECSSENPGQIDTISFSCAMHSLMAVDRDGRALSQLIIWSDMRSADTARKLRLDGMSTKLHAETGTPVHPMSPLCKLLWMKEGNRETFRTAHKFISIKEFVVWHLCGKWVVDYSVASATGMFDIHRLQWSQRALELIGIETGRLSETVTPYQRLPLTDAAIQSTGLSNGATVTLGASDGCLANLGSGATGAGDLSITIGTSGAVRMITDKPSFDKIGRLFNYCLDENSFVSGGATNNGTVILDWFAKNILKENKIHIEDFISRAATAPPGSAGLLFLPFVFGERAPYWNPDLRGMFFGLAQHHSVDHMMRSVVEGICFEIRSLVEAVEQSVRPASTIWASGGFVRSEAWVQLLANILGKEIRVRDVNDASSMGAAMMGFQSLGIPPSFQHPQTERRFLPEVLVSYRNHYDIFCRLGSKLNDEFAEIAFIQTHDNVSDLKRNA